MSHRFFFALIVTFAFHSAHASGEYQLHLRTGMLSGSFSGQSEFATGNFNLSSALDIELELHQTSNRSMSFRSIIGMESDSARMRYSYAGVGTRHYFFSQGTMTNVNGHGSRMQITPKMRHYVGMDLGIGNVLVSDFGPVLASFSSVLDFGVQYGYIHQITRQFGFQLSLGASYGYGFSSVSITSTTMRAMIGMTYYF